MLNSCVKEVVAMHMPDQRFTLGLSLVICASKTGMVRL
jgi:hypothetical protein